MPRILLIDPDRNTLMALQKALGDVGVNDVAAVPSGSFALTMIERDRPDLIVSRARIPDIDGHELCAIIRSDPTMSSILFILVAGARDDVPAAAFEAGADRMLVGDFSVDTVVTEVQSLLAGGAGAAAAEAPARPAAPPRPAADGPKGLRGSLGVMDLAEVTQAIALGGKSGHLVVTLQAGEGVVVFERGRVVHAQFGQLEGEAAFASLAATAQREAGGSFCFNPLDPAGATLPKTIQRSVESLLLSIAADIDEGRAGTTAIAPTA